jgi:putative transport protein
MNWIAATLTKYPEIAVFVVVGVGYWVGSFKLRGFGLGPVTGSLLVGLILGALVAVPVSSTAKSVLFLLFLFGIGYSVGPKFFDAMKGGGVRWSLLALVIAGTGLLTAYAVARVLGLDVGYAAGLVSGALTESPAIGTAIEAINALPLPDAERSRLVGHVAVADAICYVFGALGVILFCSVIGPRLLGIDLKTEAARVEKQFGIDRARPGVASAWRAFEWRAYRIAQGGRAAGQSVADLERAVPDARVFVERIRRGSRMIQPTADMQLEAGDVVAIAARRDVLTDVIGSTSAHEIDDQEVLDVPLATYDVFVTSSAVVGKTLEQIAASDVSLRSVFLHSIRRSGQKYPSRPEPSSSARTSSASPARARGGARRA